VRPGRDVRAGIGRTLLHGLLGWGALAGLVTCLLISRPDVNKALPPLPFLTVHLTAGQSQSWKTFPRFKRQVPVLVYHSVGGKASDITTSRTLFAEQMLALKVAGFHTLTLGQYVNYVDGHWKQLPSRPILLTFDDGRLDAYRAANAILHKYAFHATEFVVPGWVSLHPRFELGWTEMRIMEASGIWDIQEHFGYGTEYVPIDRGSKNGGAFAYLESAGLYGDPETFAHYKNRVTGNMSWGLAQLREHLPHYRSLGMAIPQSNYGQSGTNDPQIPKFLLPWLDRHYPIVFGGDYLNGGSNRSVLVPGRFSRQVSYRITMGPGEILPVLRCRLYDWALNKPVWAEYNCLRRAKNVITGATS
jgi:Polysaccharide deacetylase